MELGALICTPRSPNCAACPVRKHCVARKEKRQDQLPNLGKRETTTARRFIALIVERDGKYLARQRPAGVINAHLWEFPNVEAGARVSDPQRFVAKEMKMQIAGSKPLCVIKHSITRYRITLEVWRVEQHGATTASHGRWLAPKQLHQLAFTSAHKKILASLSARREG
jgi:A/G-specific adenine glycosylase